MASILSLLFGKLDEPCTPEIKCSSPHSKESHADFSAHYRSCDSCYFWNFERGNRYGYPTCCIESFSANLAGVPRTDAQNKAAKNNFIPCRIHAHFINSGFITIEELIRNRSADVGVFAPGAGDDN